METTIDNLMENQPSSILSQSLLTSQINEPKKNSVHFSSGTSIGNSGGNSNQYDSLKKKYFLSLGMNRPPPQMSSSVPIHSYMPSSSSSSFSNSNIINNNSKVQRTRTKTGPTPKLDTRSSDEDRRKRTTSTPIPIASLTQPPTGPIPTMAASLGTYLHKSSFDDDDDYEDNDESDHDRIFNYSSNSPKKFGREKDEDDELDQFEDDIVPVDNERSTPKSSDSPVKFIPPHELLANSKKDFSVGTAHSVAVWEQNRRRRALN